MGVLLDGVAADEDETPIADAEFVAGMEESGRRQFGAVEESAVLRGGVVDFAGTVVQVDDDDAMAARDVFIGHDHVVIRRPPEGVQPNLQRIKVGLVFQPKVAILRRLVIMVFEDGVGGSRLRMLHGEEGAIATCFEDVLPRATIFLAARCR